MTRRAALVLLALVLQTGVCRAGMVEAEHAMRAGNYAEAYCVLRPLAESGDAEAQFNLGWMYQNGYGLAVNNTLALEWWRRASEQGHIDASFAIATLYNHGEGDVERDRDKALYYFLRSAREGHDDAVLIIRSMLIRDDKSIRKRRAVLIDSFGSLFGSPRQVRPERVNVRAEPDLEAKIVNRLEQGARVVVFDEKGKWSRVGIVGEDMIAWIYSSLLEPAPEPESAVPVAPAVIAELLQAGPAAAGAEQASPATAAEAAAFRPPVEGLPASMEPAAEMPAAIAPLPASEQPGGGSIEGMSVELPASIEPATAPDPAKPGPGDDGRGIGEPGQDGGRAAVLTQALEMVAPPTGPYLPAGAEQVDAGQASGAATSSRARE